MSLVNPADINKIINALGISAAEFARQTYVSRSYISHLLNGRKSAPSKLWAAQVARFCRDSKLTAMADKIEKRMKA